MQLPCHEIENTIRKFYGYTKVDAYFKVGMFIGF